MRLLLVVAVIPLAGCISYSEAPAPPPAVVVAPPPATGTVVVQPQP